LRAAPATGESSSYAAGSAEVSRTMDGRGSVSSDAPSGWNGGDCLRVSECEFYSRSRCGVNANGRHMRLQREFRLTGMRNAAQLFGAMPAGLRGVANERRESAPPRHGRPKKPPCAEKRVTTQLHLLFQ